MNVDQSSPVIVGNNRLRYVQWRPVIAGALLAAALAFVLTPLRLLSVLVCVQQRRHGATPRSGLILLSALYLFLVAFVSYGVGAYLAGRLSTRLTSGDTADIEYRDGVHGLLAWAIATLLAGLLASGAVQAVNRLAAPSGVQAGPEASVAGEKLSPMVLTGCSGVSVRQPAI